VTPEELCDIEEIKELRQLYGHYYDGNRLEDLLTLFAEDAVVDFGEAYGKWSGMEEIRENYARIVANKSPDYGVLHAMANPWVQLVDETTARGRCYLLNLRTTVGTENPLILFGIYDDTYRKTADGWKIQRSRLDFLWPNREYTDYTDM